MLLYKGRFLGSMPVIGHGFIKVTHWRFVCANNLKDFHQWFSHEMIKIYGDGLLKKMNFIKEDNKIN